MKVEITNKEVLKRASISIELDNDQEVQAFKNILTSAENKIYEYMAHNYNNETERKIIQILKDQLK